VRRVPELALGFLFATAIWAIVLSFSVEPQSYYQICEADQYGHERCTAHNLLYVVWWHTSYVINSATITALATAAIAYFTLILKRSTDNLWEAGERQLKLARDEFLTTNRPLLRVRYFRQTAGVHDRIQVHFAVVNAGKSAAHLLGSSVMVEFADPGKLGPPVYLAGQDVITPRKFEVGASDDYVALGMGKGAEIQNNENYGKFLFVYGYLVYSDDAGNTRTTAFGRRYLRSSDRFVKIEDDDYEYED
jgi:hypothetical protein